MNICVIGPGRIGSVVAMRLSLVGKNKVTVVARGSRLQQLERDQAIVHKDGRSAPVTVHSVFDASVEYDLVVVAVLWHQVEALLPALRASKAAKIMTFFSMFGSAQALREAIGADKFEMGFPGILSNVDAETGLVSGDASPSGPTTMLSNASLVEVFQASGMRCSHEANMELWLNNQYAFAFPLLWVLFQSHLRGAGLPWAECKAAARAIHQGQDLVRKQRGSVYPFGKKLIRATPARVIAAVFWCVTRISAVRRGAAMMGDAEALRTSETAVMSRTLLAAAEQADMPCGNIAKLKLTVV